MNLQRASLRKAHSPAFLCRTHHPQYMEKENKKLPLTAQEEELCQLFVHGGVKFAGRHTPCYREVFKDNTTKAYMVARKVFTRPQVMARIKELVYEVNSETETIAMKLQISETLKAVMEETADASYTDKFGIKQSPAPLRAVSVNAARTLMDIYPVKHSLDTKGKNEASGGVTFNVIVPVPIQIKKEDEDET